MRAVVFDWDGVGRSLDAAFTHFLLPLTAGQLRCCYALLEFAIEVVQSQKLLYSKEANCKSDTNKFLAGRKMTSMQSTYSCSKWPYCKAQ